MAGQVRRPAPRRTALGTAATEAPVARVNTVVSLYYDLRVIAPTVLERPDGRAPARAPAWGPLPAALAVTTVATIAFGIGAEPLLRVAEGATVLSG